MSTRRLLAEVVLLTFGVVAAGRQDSDFKPIGSLQNTVATCKDFVDDDAIYMSFTSMMVKPITTAISCWKSRLNHMPAISAFTKAKSTSPIACRAKAQGRHTSDHPRHRL